MGAYIEVTGVSKSFPAAGGVRRVLGSVSLSVERGEFVSILGPMASGKSTLLALLAGLIEPDRGSVLVDGKPLDGVRRDAAIVFQNYSLLPWFSAMENVRLAVSARFPEWSTERRRDQAVRYLQMVGLGNALHRRPRQLSGGMRQRVAIARAFATEPQILFLDEPFGALDALTRGALQQELAQLCSAAHRPVTTVMVTNNVDEAILLSDRIVPMTSGPAATLGAPVAVPLSRPRSPEALAHDEAADRVRTTVVESLTNGVRRLRPARRPAAALEPAMALVSVESE